MPFVAITRLRLRGFRFLPVFFIHAMRTASQAQAAQGNLAVAILRDARRTFWTLTVWADDAAARHYTLSNPHRDVMKRLAHWCDEASVVHWSQETPELPSWEEAHRRMQTEGRPSRVDHPTEAHRKHEIAVPKAGRTNVLRIR